MKNLFVAIVSAFSILFGFNPDVCAQYILAGQHGSGNCFYDVNPDSTLVGPNNHATNYPPAKYSIDLDGDGLRDCYLSAIGFWVNGMGYSKIAIYPDSGSVCQIAYGYTDTCHTPNATYFLYNMAKSLHLNDTIDGNLVWSAKGLYLNYTDWVLKTYSCGLNGFINDSLGNYIGVRVIKPADTVYGWVKVTNVGAFTYTVQEFACSKNNTGIEEHSDPVRIFPVPTSNTVTIESRLTGFELIVYNQYGMEVMTQKINSGKTAVDLSGHASGVYIFRLLRGDSVIARKIIKL
jgi:hypothetical protein